MLLVAIGVNLWVFSPGLAEGFKEEGKESAKVNESDYTADLTYILGGKEGVYTGSLKKGLPDGEGFFIAGEGRNWAYEGMWHEGAMAGRGVLTTPKVKYSGTFVNNVMEGNFKVYSGDVVIYEGEIHGDRLNGYGSTYTKTGEHIYTGSFKDDMLDERAEDRLARGMDFYKTCIVLDIPTYYQTLSGSEPYGKSVYVWGRVLGIGSQEAAGTAIIAYENQADFPLAITYRYGVDEPKINENSTVYVWGVLTGLFSYTDDGQDSLCPEVEAICIQIE